MEIWELFVPGVEEGQRYEYAILTRAGDLRLKADPFAFEAELPPETSSVVNRWDYEWGDAEWLARRGATDQHSAPMSISRSTWALGA